MEKFYNSTKYRNVSRAKEAVYHVYITGNKADSTGAHRRPREKSRPAYVSLVRTSCAVEKLASTNLSLAQLFWSMKNIAIVTFILALCEPLSLNNLCKPSFKHEQLAEIRCLLCFIQLLILWPPSYEVLHNLLAVSCGPVIGYTGYYLAQSLPVNQCLALTNAEQRFINIQGIEVRYRVFFWSFPSKFIVFTSKQP